VAARAKTATISDAMNAREIARRLSGEVSGRDAFLCPGPGHSPSDRSLSVKFDPAAPDGYLTYSHAGDDWRHCRDHVRELLGLPRWQPGDQQRRNVQTHHIDKWNLAAGEAETNEGPHEIIRIANARRIWKEALDPRGTLAEAYLRGLRRLDLPDDLAGRVLRFHPSCPWRNEYTRKIDRVPALIAPFRSIDHDTITGIHRIALKPFSAKPDRRMLGIVHHAAIKLDSNENVTHGLHIGEGAETCLAAWLSGFRPVWALGSARAIAAFPVLSGIEAITVLGEVGDGGANRRAARECAARWIDSGRQAFIVAPQVGADLNDVWREIAP
jgi:putative DNA primase/helicase